MRLVIATPLYPPDIGGPAAYAKELNERLRAAGHTVMLVSFSEVRHYPKLLRHVLYFFHVYAATRGADAVFAFDTWSTGIPALLAARLRRVKTVVRVGGDVLWETYIERSHILVKLSEFYGRQKHVSLKEKLLFQGTKWVTRHADALVFNTAWQKRIWERVYSFPADQARVIENAYPAERTAPPAKGRVFVAVGRDRILKNMQMLERVFTELQRTFPDIILDTRSLPPEEHERRMRDAYAVVIPSVSEVSPNTAIDALRYGKPCILTADTGARERLAEVGIFIDTLQPDDVREAIVTLLEPVAYAQACARVQKFKFVHSWDEVTNEFLALTTSLCAS